MSSLDETGVMQRKFEISYDSIGNIKSVCNNPKSNESVIIDLYDSSANIKDIIQTQQHKKNGVAYSFFPSGHLSRIKNYKDDTLSGRFTIFYDGYDVIKQVVPEINNGKYDKYFEYNWGRGGAMDDGIVQFQSDTILETH